MSSRLAPRLLSLSGILALTSASCALGRAPIVGTETTPSGAVSVQLNVTNDYGSSLRVYAIASGITWRIGTVLPGLASHFVLPRGVAGNGPVEFVALGDDNRPIRSGSLLLVPGNVVDFKIGNQPLSSTATVRP